MEPKNLFLGDFFRGFLVRPFHAQIFCQMKGLMKINNRDKFHLHSICGSWAILGGFWGPNSPKYSLILVKVAPEAVFGENKRVLENSTFYGNCTSPKFNLFLRFCPTLGPIYPMKEAKIEKSINLKVKI